MLVAMFIADDFPMALLDLEEEQKL